MLKFRSLVMVLMALVLSSCANLQSNIEPPSVSLTALRPLPSTGLEQRFEVQLRLTNPNSVALPIKGMSYSLSINGFKLATGVSDQIPQIGPYQEVELSLPVSTQLFGVLQLVGDVVSSGRNDVDYLLEAKLDAGSALLPKMRVVEEGSINLSNLRPPGRSIAM